MGDQFEMTSFREGQKQNGGTIHGAFARKRSSRSIGKLDESRGTAAPSRL